MPCLCFVPLTKGDAFRLATNRNAGGRIFHEEIQDYFLDTALEHSASCALQPLLPRKHIHAFHDGQDGCIGTVMNRYALRAISLCRIFL